MSFHGEAIDEKTPLLRSMAALSREASRLCTNLGFDVASCVPNIGLEQEFFLVPRSAFYDRPDLQLAGRTVMGRQAARGRNFTMAASSASGMTPCSSIATP